jgi:predicted Zn-dependent protease
MSKRKHATEMGFKQAVYLHRAGRLGEAEQFYRQILTTAPNHSDSLHMLGVLALQTARHAEALYYLEQAIARQPTVAIYHVNRANALRASGDLAAAVAVGGGGMQRGAAPQAQLCRGQSDTGAHFARSRPIRGGGGCLSGRIAPRPEIA